MSKVVSDLLDLRRALDAEIDEMIEVYLEKKLDIDVVDSYKESLDTMLETKLSFIRSDIKGE